MAFLSALLFALVALPLACALPCTRNHHCASARPNHLGICAPRHGVCLSLPRLARQKAPDDADADDADDDASEANDDDADDDGPELEFFLLPDLINETNAIHLPVSAKRDIVSAVKTVYLNYNPHRFLHQNYLHLDFPAVLDAINLTEEMTNVDFYANMTHAFQLMDDYHSIFVTPAPLNETFAALGFSTAKFYGRRSMRRRYMVTDFVGGLIPSNSSLTIGSELLSIDGVPVDKYVLQLGKDSPASNAAAQIDAGILLLSFRVLAFEPIPFNPTVDIVFRTEKRVKKSVKLPWHFVKIADPETAETMSRPVHPLARERLHRRPRPIVFTEHEKRELLHNGPTPDRDALEWALRTSEESRMPIEVSANFTDLFSAEIIKTESGPVGRLILPSFGSDATLELAKELTRILRLMPRNGLIIDVRFNTGGSPEYVKILAELLVDDTVLPNPTTIRATELVRDGFVNVDTSEATKEELDILSAFSSALNTSVDVGEAFTGPSADLYAVEFTERFVPRAYFGPVVTLMDGLCYSAGDLFVSLQKDYGYSPVVGVSDNVGAGGASVLQYSDLVALFPSQLKAVQAQFSTAALRYFRSGTSKGAIVENFGVEPDVRYYQTKRDARRDDCDLYEFLGRMLKDMKKENETETDAMPSPEGIFDEEFEV